MSNHYYQNSAPTGVDEPLPVWPERERKMRRGAAIMVVATLVLGIALSGWVDSNSVRLKGYNGEANSWSEPYDTWNTDCSSFLELMTPEERRITSGDYLSYFRWRTTGNRAKVPAQEASRFQSYVEDACAEHAPNENPPPLNAATSVAFKRFR